jgi:hypothetical protein
MGQLVFYDNPQHEGPGSEIRLDIVTPAGVVSAEGPELDTVSYKGQVVVSLTGGKPDSLIVTQLICGAMNCSGNGDDTVFEYRNGAWSKAKLRPVLPRSIQDYDRDGVPEFQFPIVEIEVFECGVPCRVSRENMVELFGLEQWDGAKFARDLSTLRAWYDARYRAAVAAVAQANPAGSADSCPAEAVGHAAARYVYGRIHGETHAVASTASSALGAALDTSQCDISWPELAAALKKAVLPRPTRKSSARAVR